MPNTCPTAADALAHVNSSIRGFPIIAQQYSLAEWKYGSGDKAVSVLNKRRNRENMPLREDKVPSLASHSSLCFLQCHYASLPKVFEPGDPLTCRTHRMTPSPPASLPGFHPVAGANLIDQVFIRYVIFREIHDHQFMFLGLHLNDLVGQHAGAVIQYVKHFQIFHPDSVSVASHVVVFT
ncbi:MAG: hypothetical protein HKM94_02865 [Halobacteria archaeon]|nr:hypothetical protein [Halobacteria archaeon]